MIVALRLVTTSPIATGTSSAHTATIPAAHGISDLPREQFK
jgi:hypothetical protein